jgi:tetratricopeptide (TPR) repeat protein
MRAWVCVLVISVTSVAVAAPAPAPALSEQAARTHDQNARHAYAAGAYKKAIAEWKAGYALYPSADFLFNMAQAYRQLRDLDDSIALFQRYLREKPNATNAAEVRAEIAEMQKILAPSRVPPPPAPDPLPPPKPEPEPKPEPVPVPTPTPTPTPVVESHSTTLRTAGLVTAITGAVLVGAGVAFELKAHATAQDLQAAASANQMWNPALADSESAMHLDTTLGVTFLATGGVAAVAGVILYVVGAPHAHVAPTVSRHGGGITFVMEY